MNDFSRAEAMALWRGISDSKLTTAGLMRLKTNIQNLKNPKQTERATKESYTLIQWVWQRITWRRKEQRPSSTGQFWEAQSSSGRRPP